MHSIFFLLLFLGGITSTFGQTEQETIITDRPGEGTDAPYVVGPGRVQLETGIFWQGDRQGDQQLALYPNLLVRVGLIKRIELRGSINVFEIGRNTATYISPMVLGTKIHLTENQGWIPQSALVVNFTLPGIGSEPFQTDHLSPEIKLLMEHTLTERFGITTNLGVNWGNYDASIPFYAYALSVDYRVNDLLSAFGEFYGFWSSVEDIHLFNAGFAFLLLPDVQFDIGSGIGVSENAPDYYVGGGLSARF